MEHKYKDRDIVLIYDCKELVGGGLGIIEGHDAFASDYLVRDFANNMSLSRWVREENLSKIDFKKPAIKKSLIQQLWQFIRRR